MKACGPKRSQTTTRARAIRARLTATEKVVATVPGHVEEVRRLVLDPLTKAQAQHLTNIGQRILRAIDPNDRCLR